MIDHPETIRTSHRRVACDGSGEVPAALGHPRVWLEIDESGAVDCGYCDRHFVLIGGPADHGLDAGDAKAA
ncbi:MAG: zinc-finger domain-containing protein [Sphingomonadales bacterium]